METEVIIRIVMSLVLVCSLAALFIVFVLPKYYKTELKQDLPFKLISKVRLDIESQILVLENKEFQRLVFITGKQGISLIGSLDSEDKFIFPQK